MIETTKLDKIVKTHCNPGYASIYQFDEDAALDIKSTGMSRGFDRFDVYAESLTIDIDEGDVGLKAAEGRLSEYGYEVWSSGGKGYHIVINHEPVFDKRLPYSHKRVVEELGIICDTSLYQPGRILSLPGRVHPKTKKKKEYIRSHEGKLLEFKLEEKPKINFDFDGVDEDASTVFMRLADLTKYSPYKGQRHMTLWTLSRTMSKSGISYEDAIVMLQMINRMWKEPKDPAEVTAACEQGYRR
jgi:hypothetical protein